MDIAGVVGALWTGCLFLVAVCAFVVLVVVTVYLMSILVRPKHLATLCNIGPPRELKALVNIFGHRLEATTKADAERDVQMRALDDSVRELHHRVTRIEAALTSAVSDLLTAGGANVADYED